MNLPTLLLLTSFTVFLLGHCGSSENRGGASGAKPAFLFSGWACAPDRERTLSGISPAENCQGKSTDYFYGMVGGYAAETTIWKRKLPLMQNSCKQNAMLRAKHGYFISEYLDSVINHPGSNFMTFFKVDLLIPSQAVPMPNAGLYHCCSLDRETGRCAKKGNWEQCVCSAYVHLPGGRSNIREFEEIRPKQIKQIFRTAACDKPFECAMKLSVGKEDFSTRKLAISIALGYARAGRLKTAVEWINKIGPGNSHSRSLSLLQAAKSYVAPYIRRKGKPGPLPPHVLKNAEDLIKQANSFPLISSSKAIELLRESLAELYIVLGKPEQVLKVSEALDVFQKIRISRLLRRAGFNQKALILERRVILELNKMTGRVSPKDTNMNTKGGLTLATIVIGFIDLGRYKKAFGIARRLEDIEQINAVAFAFVKAGRYPEARGMLTKTTDYLGAREYAHMAGQFSKAGRRQKSRDMLRKAQKYMSATKDPAQRTSYLGDVAEEYLEGGGRGKLLVSNLLARAALAGASIKDSGSKSIELEMIAVLYARIGLCKKAVRVARRTDSFGYIMVHLTKKCENPSQLRFLLRAAKKIKDSDMRSKVLATLAGDLAQNRRFRRALHTLKSITVDKYRALALVAIGRAYLFHKRNMSKEEQKLLQ